MHMQRVYLGLDIIILVWCLVCIEVAMFLIPVCTNKERTWEDSINYTNKLFIHESTC
jgi:hypothetical protein